MPITNPNRSPRRKKKPARRQPYRPGCRQGYVDKSRRSMIVGGAIGLGVLTASIATAAVVSDDETEVFTGPPDLHRLYLFDASDAYTRIQNQVLDEALYEDALKGLSEGDRLDVYLLTERQRDPVEKFFSMRAPKKSTGIGGIVFGDVEGDARRYREDFEDPFRAAIADVREPEERDYTPLLEGIQQASITLRTSQAQVKELIVISDALVNLEDRGHYHAKDGLSDETYLASVKGDLEGALVRVIYLTRASEADRQTDAHKDWLRAHLKWMGASNVDLIVT